MFNNLKSISFREKNIKQIIRVRDNAILYKKTENDREPLEFTFTGKTLTQYTHGSFSGTNMFIDYGDGTIETTTGTFGHTYSENGTYIVKIYGVTSLWPNCFKGCTGLTSITIPNNVTNIRAGCFDECTGLTNINIPNSVTEIGEYCFEGCIGLTSITLPNNLTSLGYDCFWDCTGLTNINIPNSVTEIGEYCFRGCTNIVSVTLNWTNPTITYLNSRLSDCTHLTTINIPTGTTSLYIAQGYPSNKLVEISNEIYAPSFTEDNPTPTNSLDSGYQVSQSNGELTLIGGCISDGWSNDDLWEVDYDVKWNGTRYQWFRTLMALPNTPLLGGWEGCIASPQSGLGSNVQRDNTDCLTVVHTDIWSNPSTPWIHINIKKISPTTLVVTKTGDTANNGTVTFTNCELLPSYERMSVGATSNNGNVRGKPTFKNFKVTKPIKVIKDEDLEDGEELS